MYETYRVTQPRDVAVFTLIGTDETKKAAAKTRCAICDQATIEKAKGGSAGGFKNATTFKDGKQYRTQDKSSPVN
jgi:hypothetical protein